MMTFLCHLRGCEMFLLHRFQEDPITTSKNDPMQSQVRDDLIYILTSVLTKLCFMLSTVVAALDCCASANVCSLLR